jgi:hypothetical protein
MYLLSEGIVRQVVGDVKTEYSRRAMSIDPAMVMVLKAWRQKTQFSADSDWGFASSLKLGRLPWSYPWVWRVFTKAAKDAGIGSLAGCGKTRFEADAVPRNSLVSTAQPDKKKACEETTSSSWMCSAISALSNESPKITPCALFVS